MRSVVLVLAGTNDPGSVPAIGNIILILAALVLYIALRMLGQALQPLREVFRAVVAALGTTLLVILAFALIIISLAFRH